MLYFFRSLIDFDWIEGYLIPSRVGLGRIRIGSDQFNFLKNQIKLSSNPNKSDGFFGLDQVLPPLHVIEGDRRQMPGLYFCLYHCNS
jgi:hypothetical protein